MAKRKIGISCAGGGIKALAQIGVIRYLDKLDIQGDGFSGTSMGSIVAAFLAAGLDVNDIEQAFLEIEHEVIKHKLFKFTNAQVFPLIKNDASGLISPLPFMEVLNKQFKRFNLHHFEDLKYPLTVVAVDLKSGRTVLFTNDDIKDEKNYIIIRDATLLEALQASCSFPMVFDTMMFRDLQLVDGGVSMNAPVLPLREIGYNPILSITMSIETEYEASTHLLDIANRVVEIVLNEGDAQAAKQADLNINAYDKEIGIFSFGKGKDAIQLGYKLAKEHHDQLIEFKKASQTSTWASIFK